MASFFSFSFLFFEEFQHSAGVFSRHKTQQTPGSLQDSILEVSDREIIDKHAAFLSLFFFLRFVVVHNQI